MQIPRPTFRYSKTYQVSRFCVQVHGQQNPESSNTKVEIRVFFLPATDDVGIVLLLIFRISGGARDRIFPLPLWLVRKLSVASDLLEMDFCIVIWHVSLIWLDQSTGLGPHCSVYE